MSTYARRRRDDLGAVAVMTVVLASLLMITAALSVDLGNAWARKRDVQTQADIAAISAGNWGKDQNLFPATTSAQRSAIASKVAEYMLESNNVATGQDGVSAGELAIRLLDGDVANGHLEFSADGYEMRVIAPGATVNFGLAGVFGFTDVDVQAEATVSIFSELPGSNVLPFWLPDGCAYGPVDGDTTNGKGQGSGTKKDSSTSFTATVTPEEVPFGSTATVVFTVDKKDLDDKVAPVVYLEHSEDAELTFDLTGTWIESTPGGGSDKDKDDEDKTTGSQWQFTLSMDATNVTGTPGTWSFQIANNGKLSSIGTLAVGDSPGDSDDSFAPLATTCVGSDRGNFGQLMSPRDGAYNHQRDLALNIAEGLDHQLVPYPSAPADNCENPSLLPKAQLDDASTDGNNCIQGSTGNDGPYLYEGLIAGVKHTSVKGRLDVSRGATKDGCNGGNATIDSKSINNDLLSCYLEDGFSLSQLVTDSAHDGMLDPSVTDSPRFVWMPVVYADDRAIKDFQPLLKFVPGFITDETVATNSSSNATAENGISVNGNSVKSLKVFTFHPNALRESDRSPVTGYDPVLERDTLRLID